MGSTQEKHLPLKGTNALIYTLSFLVAGIMAAVSVVGLRYRTLVYPTDAFVRAFVPNDVVNLLIGLPILLGSMGLARRQKLIGLLCWIGALLYVLYNYLVYVFALPPGWVFLSHLALVMVSVYTLIGLIASIDGKMVRQRLMGAVPEKVGGGVLAGLGLLVFLRVLGVIGSSLANGIEISETELATHTADFLLTPAWIIVGILLWRRKELGYVTGLGLLFQASMLFIALIVFLLVQPWLTSAPFAAADVVVVFAMGCICFVPFALFVRGAVGK